MNMCRVIVYNDQKCNLPLLSCRKTLVLHDSTKRSRQKMLLGFKIQQNSILLINLFITNEGVK